jgi:hypothetical protein
MTLSMAMVSVMVAFPHLDVTSLISKDRDPVARQRSAVPRSLKATAEYRQVVV